MTKLIFAAVVLVIGIIVSRSFKAKEKKSLFRKAAMIQVSITFTVPSAVGLSFGLTGLAGMIAVP